MSKKLRAQEINGVAIGKGLKDRSPQIPQRDKIDFQLSIRERDDLTERQKIILETMVDKHTRCVFIDGVYGSGKTYLATLAALKLLNTGRVDELIYIRNPLESSSSGKIGFIPGSISEKMAPYAAPFWDKLNEFLPTSDIVKLEKDNRFQALPLGFVRGRSWNCKAIIVDEASSLSWDDLILIMTRCGEFTRLFLIGDSLNQNDLGNKSGFRKMFELFGDEQSMQQGIFTFELREKTDIVRSAFLRFLMERVGLIK